jgi:hypothetical protein
MDLDCALLHYGLRLSCSHLCFINDFWCCFFHSSDCVPHDDEAKARQSAVFECPFLVPFVSVAVYGARGLVNKPFLRLLSWRWFFTSTEAELILP